MSERTHKYDSLINAIFPGISQRLREKERTKKRLDEAADILFFVRNKTGFDPNSFRLSPKWGINGIYADLVHGRYSEGNPTPSATLVFANGKEIHIRAFENISEEASASFKELQKSLEERYAQEDSAPHYTVIVQEEN